MFQLHQQEQRNNIVARFKLDLLTWKKDNQLIKEETFLSELNNYTHPEYQSSIKSAAWFLIANTYAEKGRNYQALKDTTNQFELVKALEIIQQAAKEINTTDYKTSGLLDLANQIKSKEI